MAFLHTSSNLTDVLSNGQKGRWRRSTGCWRPRRTRSAGRRGTSGARSGWTRAPGHYTRKLLTSAGRGASVPLEPLTHGRLPRVDDLFVEATLAVDLLQGPLHLRPQSVEFLGRSIGGNPTEAYRCGGADRLRRRPSSPLEKRYVPSSPRRMFKRGKTLPGWMRLRMAAAAVILVSATGMQGDVRRRVGQRVTPMPPCPQRRIEPSNQAALSGSLPCLPVESGCWLGCCSVV